MATITSHGLFKILRLPKYLVSTNYLTKTVIQPNLLPTVSYFHKSSPRFSTDIHRTPRTVNYSTSTTTQDQHLKPNLDEFRAKEEKRDAELLKEAAEDQNEQEKKEEEEREKKKDQKAQAVKVKILETSLKFVPVHGWSTESIVKGAEELGYPGVAHGMFTEGPIELIAHFYSKCNQELISQLKTETNDGQKEVEDPFEFLVRAVRMRLELTLAHKSNWSQALAIMTLPQNVPKSLAQLLTLVDDICFYAGDRSVDFNWYTRRVGLATIYKMVELYMLQDTSENHVKTWEFLRNRMGEAAQIQMMMAQTEGVGQKFQRSFNSAFVTARNILGVGYNDRR
ncbi:COQ9 family protein [Megaselia abdita]